MTRSSGWLEREEVSKLCNMTVCAAEKVCAGRALDIVPHSSLMLYFMSFVTHWLQRSLKLISHFSCPISIGDAGT